MDWLNWTVRAFSVLGGIMFLLCFWMGARSLYSILSNSLEIWAAKKKFYTFQRQNPELFKRYLQYGEEGFKDKGNEAKKDDA